ncbi:anti-sigma factor family protein [Burkholderia gladioli]|uniref:anti-sigma factor family protein n=1 Tax=Burkholderia gladioli TaxID=28095 RepID=UPI003B5123F6
MTSVPEPIPSEQDMQAYADGRLAADREHSVSAYLARRPAEARRVAFYARVNAQLRNHFPDDGLAAAVLPLSAAPAALSVPPAQSTPALAAVPASRRRASRFGYRLAAAALLSLLAAAILPRLLRVPDHRLDTAAYAMLLALPGIDPAMGRAAPSPAAAPAGGAANAPNAANASTPAASQAPARPANPQRPAAASLAAGALAGSSLLLASRPAPRDAAPDLGAVGFHLAGARRLDIWPFASANAYVYRNAAGEPAVLVAHGTPEGGGHWQARRIGGVRLLEWTSRAGQHIVIAGDAGTRGLMRAADLLAGD